MQGKTGQVTLPHWFPPYFWCYVDMHLDSDLCWPWTSGKNAKYGTYGMGKGLPLTGRKVLAHRLAMWIVNGSQVPAGKMVCHKCNNPICVNPTHLYIGTAMDNYLDQLRDGKPPIWQRRKSYRKP